MAREEVTKIAADGLRYKSKQGGSPFGVSSHMQTMSCFKCGQHKSRTLGVFKRLIGQSMFFCAECAAPKSLSNSA